MARAATETPAGGPDGPRVRARDPGHGRRRRLGERRGARERHGRRPRVRDGRCSPTARRRELPRRRARVLVPPQPVQGRRGAGQRATRARSSWRRRSGSAPTTRRDQGAARRDPALAPGAPAARAPVGRQRVPQPARRLGGPPDRRARASRATVSAARSCPRSTPTSSSTTRTGPRPTSAALAGARPRGGPRASRDRARVRDRVRGRLVRLDTRGDRLMPVPPLAHDPAATPVAVVLGGPSAEHDVSIVSGTAIADALAGSGYPVETWLIDLGGAWWRLPRRPPPRRPAAGRLRRPRDPRRRRAASTPAAALEALAGARCPAASCSSRSTARSARTARSRRCARRPGSPTRGPA